MREEERKGGREGEREGGREGGGDLNNPSRAELQFYAFKKVTS